MNHWVATLTGRIAAIGTILFALAACGGGGGGGGGFLPSNPDGDQTRYTITIEVVDDAGAPTSLVTATRPATLRVTIREDNPAANPVSGEVVTAAAQFAIISPENGQALTDGDGIAEFIVRAGEILGADSISLSVESPGGTITSSVGVDVQEAGLRLGSFDGTAFVDGQIGLSIDSIAFRGSIALRLAVVDENGDSVTTTEQIRLSSNCSLAGQASFGAIGSMAEGSSTLTIETVDGLASAEYRAGSCETSDEITATLIDSSATATGSITIASRTANFIGFISTDTAIIALRGTGSPGRPEVATVVFEVLEAPVFLEAGDPMPGTPGYLTNSERAPLPGVTVNFSLTNSLGGITLLSTSAVTDANGLVEVDLRSGNVATSTLVIASFEAADGNGNTRPLQATSSEIVIGTGLPDQNSISLSASQFNVPNAASIDGVEVTITVRMADRFNNPVADGTSAVFTTEYGVIEPSCQTTAGVCSVTWTSQAPRFPIFNRDMIQTIENDGSYDCPSHTGSFGPCPDDLGAIRGLRSTISVTAVGEENFIDADGDGRYSEGETFANLPEAFNDHNEDGVFTPALGPQCPLPSTDENCEAAGMQEEFFDFNNDGAYNTNDDPALGEPLYNGSLCPVDGDGVFCSRTLVNVRDSLVLTLSSEPAGLQTLAADVRFSLDRAVTNIAEGNDYVLYISDVYNNAPGVGTVITVTATGACNLFDMQESLTATVPDLGGLPGAYTFPELIQVEGDGGPGQVVVSAGELVIGTFGCITTEEMDGGLTVGPGA